MTRSNLLDESVAERMPPHFWIQTLNETLIYKIRNIVKCEKNFGLLINLVEKKKNNHFIHLVQISKNHELLKISLCVFSYRFSFYFSFFSVASTQNKNRNLSHPNSNPLPLGLGLKGTISFYVYSSRHLILLTYVHFIKINLRVGTYLHSKE